jgi:hypothetical protein
MNICLNSLPVHLNDLEHIDHFSLYLLLIINIMLNRYIKVNPRLLEGYYICF